MKLLEKTFKRLRNPLSRLWVDDGSRKVWAKTLHEPDAFIDAQQWNVWQECRVSCRAMLPYIPGDEPPPVSYRRRRCMPTYLEGIKRLAIEHRARQTAEQLERSRSLEDRIRYWYEDLPPQERRARYTMNQLVLLFGTAPGRIGAALYRLGWQRKTKLAGWEAPTVGIGSRRTSGKGKGRVRSLLSPPSSPPSPRLGLHPYRVASQVPVVLPLPRRQAHAFALRRALRRHRDQERSVPDSPPLTDSRRRRPTQRRTDPFRQLVARLQSSPLNPYAGAEAARYSIDAAFLPPVAGPFAGYALPRPAGAPRFQAGCSRSSCGPGSPVLPYRRSRCRSTIPGFGVLLGLPAG